MLEIDDARLGVRAQELGYPLAGAAYDPHDRRVELSFGEGGSEGPHLTHFIPHVSAVAVVGGGAEGDSALRVEHRDGRTLLTFPPSHEGASAPAAAPPSTV